MLGVLRRFAGRLLGWPLGTVTAAAYLNGCRMRLSEDRRCVEVYIPGTVVLVDRESNERIRCSGRWLGLVDVGHMWDEFEVFDPDRPSRRRYLGSSASYETAQTYANLDCDVLPDPDEPRPRGFPPLPQLPEAAGGAGTAW